MGWIEVQKRMKEIWKDIPEFKKYYQISDRGNLRRKARKFVFKFRGGYSFRTLKLKNLTTCLHTSGYTFKCFTVQKKARNRFIHSMVLSAFIGPRPKGHQCRHLNGNKRDNNLKNLKWGTRQENKKDQILHGTSSHGKKRPIKLFSKKEVLFLRKKYRSGNITISELAKRVGRHRTSVADIVRYRTHK